MLCRLQSILVQRFLINLHRVDSPSAVTDCPNEIISSAPRFLRGMIYNFSQDLGESPDQDHEDVSYSEEEPQDDARLNDYPEEAVMHRRSLDD